MSVQQTVGLALIARDEAGTLPTLLKSIEGAFDQVVLVDTGSQDKTRDVFTKWAEKHCPRFVLAETQWVDDFAAARNYADSLLETDWRAWADADDELQGAASLRALANTAPENLAAFVCHYDYAHDSHGNVVCVLKRERLVRRGLGTWIGRVHEAQIFPAGVPTQIVDPAVVKWVHRKNPDTVQSNERNLRILRKWDETDPDNPRVVGYLGTEEAARGELALAIEYFKRYLGLRTTWDQERAQIHRKLASCYLALGEPQDAMETSLAALAVLPDWPDSHLSLAEACYALHEYEKAAKWAREVLRLGHPDSLLILNPLDYTFKPRLVLAAALGAIGQVDEALALGREALELVPDHDELRRHAGVWQATSKREHVANSWIAAAGMLCAHDEQLKALALLETTVPHFATDHPRVVAERSRLRERLLWVNDPNAYARHYEVGGSKPEDGVPDDKVVELCDRLPRAQFLKNGLAEQLAA